MREKSKRKKIFDYPVFLWHITFFSLLHKEYHCCKALIFTVKCQLSGRKTMIAFIDVSGNPYEQPDKSPWTAISTICIRKRSIYEITATLHRLKKDILLNEYIEMKSTDLVNSSTLNNPLRKTTFLNETISRCVDHPDCKFAALVFMNSGKNQKK